MDSCEVFGDAGELEVGSVGMTEEIWGMEDVKLAPLRPKLFHIVHIDRLANIVREGHIWSDSEASKRKLRGTNIGMQQIKAKRLKKRLVSHPELTVGQCVPFYFCPRSIMLYVIATAKHPSLEFLGGQEPIVHLQTDLRRVVKWAEKRGLKWAFTMANASSAGVIDYTDLDQLNAIDWKAVTTRFWSNCRESKQAEFLVQRQLSASLIEAIGVYSERQLQQVQAIFESEAYRPKIEVKPEWYYDNLTEHD